MVGRGTASRCPEKAMYCGDSLRHKGALQKAGVVEGKMVEDIVLDTGCSKTLIHHALVPRKKMLQGEEVTIRCAHGDNALYPLAMVDLVVDGVPLTVEAAVSKTLPVSVLLGTDVPELVRFLRADSKDSRNFGGCETLIMVTRAGAKKQEAEKEIQWQKEEESEVRPTPIVSELAEEVQREEELATGGTEVNPELCSLDEELFSGGRPRVKLTRSQKRMQRRQHQQDIQVGALDMLAVELQKLQETDPSLAQVRSMCGTRKPQESESHYFNSEGLLFWRWIQRWGKPESALEQLVPPTQCRKAIQQLAHEVPLAAHLGSGLVQPEKSKVQSVESFPTPTTKKQVRCFLGMTGYYREFIPDYASIAAPLTDLTKNAAPNQVVWTDRCEGSFQKLKSLLCREPVLHSPDFTKEFVLQTDASDVGVGAVPSQLDEEGADHPVAYYSRKLLAREQKHATIEKECLAIKLATQAFRVYLLGRPFIIQIDHQALEWLDQLRESNAKLSRWSIQVPSPLSAWKGQRQC